MWTEMITTWKAILDATEEAMLCVYTGDYEAAAESLDEIEERGTTFWTIPGTIFGTIFGTMFATSTPHALSVTSNSQKEFT